MDKKARAERNRLILAEVALGITTVADIAKKYGVTSARVRQLTHPDRHSARVQVREAIRTGKLQRPDHCSKCGSKGDIEAHHEDYSKPLDIEWLCPQCHGKHKKLNPRHRHKLALKRIDYSVPKCGRCGTAIWGKRCPQRCSVMSWPNRT